MEHISMKNNEKSKKSNSLQIQFSYKVDNFAKEIFANLNFRSIKHSNARNNLEPEKIYRNIRNRGRIILSSQMG